MEIFDKNGKVLSISDVIGDFIKKQCKERDIIIDDLFLKFDNTSQEIDIYINDYFDNRPMYLDSIKFTI